MKPASSPSKTVKKTDETSLQTTPPLPLGSFLGEKGCRFSVAAEAEAMQLLFFDDEGVLKEVIELDAQKHRTGKVWHVFIPGPPPGNLYAWKTPQGTALDPYAKASGRRAPWGETDDNDLLHKGRLFKTPGFDWQGVKKPHIAPKDLIIYEMHVRSFTQDASSKTAHPGTFSAITEKIPYLLELGVNAIELMLIFSFNENEYSKKSSRQHLYNYWGYSTQNFFTLARPYCSSSHIEEMLQEWKTMVRELHRAGIAIILDVVFNHTAEGVFDQSPFSFSLLDKTAYYLPGDFTGCGNTFRNDHPAAVNLVIDSLHYWTIDMGVDGFRFDLAGAFARDAQGQIKFPSPLIHAISHDPLLADSILIAEPWDAHGGYLIGQFAAFNRRWIEWNDQFRDITRRFIKGDSDLKRDFATRISGSSDIYGGASPSSSLNFLTAHDGFTLADAVSYNNKHNAANEEEGRDGHNANFSWNCGFEGPTKKPDVIRLRTRQMKNFYLTLALSQGPIMILMGDEYGHTKNGNNNTWCHDSPLNWLLWEEASKRGELFRFLSGLLHLRKKFPMLRKGSFLSPDEMVWHGRTPLHPDWYDPSPFIAFEIHDRQNGYTFFAVFNAERKKESLRLPDPPYGSWKIIADSGAPYPDDFFPPGAGPAIAGHHTKILPYASLLLISQKA